MVGWTDMVMIGKRGYENPWYSGGEEPEYVGEIHVCLLSAKTIETQIKFSDDNEWQPPVLQHRDASNKRDW